MIRRILYGLAGVLVLAVVLMAIREQKTVSPAATVAETRPDATVSDHRRLSLSEVTAEQLHELDGMTDEIAAAILQYRSRQTHPLTVQELRTVKGVTDELWERWLPYWEE